MRRLYFLRRMLVNRRAPVALAFVLLTVNVWSQTSGPGAGFTIHATTASPRA